MSLDLKPIIHIEAFQKAVLINAIIYLVLIFIAGVLRNFGPVLIAILFLCAVTVIISISALSFYKNFSEKESISIKESAITGFSVGALSWFTAYIILAIPVIYSIFKEANTTLTTTDNNLAVLFSATLLIMSITGTGCVTAAISTLFSPFFSHEKPGSHYFLTLAGFIGAAIIQTGLFVIFVLLPVYSKVVNHMSEML
jgi:hypothetical protein